MDCPAPFSPELSPVPAVQERRQQATPLVPVPPPSQTAPSHPENRETYRAAARHHQLSGAVYGPAGGRGGVWGAGSGARVQPRPPCRNRCSCSRGWPGSPTAAPAARSSMRTSRRPALSNTETGGRCSQAVVGLQSSRSCIAVRIELELETAKLVCWLTK